MARLRKQVSAVTPLLGGYIEARLLADNKRVDCAGVKTRAEKDIEFIGDSHSYKRRQTRGLNITDVTNKPDHQDLTVRDFARLNNVLRPAVLLSWSDFAEGERAGLSTFRTMSGVFTPLDTFTFCVPVIAIDHGPDCCANVGTASDTPFMTRTGEAN